MPCLILRSSIDGDIQCDAIIGIDRGEGIGQVSDLIGVDVQHGEVSFRRPNGIEIRQNDWRFRSDPVSRIAPGWTGRSAFGMQLKSNGGEESDDQHQSEQIEHAMCGRTFQTFADVRAMNVSKCSDQIAEIFIVN